MSTGEKSLSTSLQEKHLAAALRESLHPAELGHFRNTTSLRLAFWLLKEGKNWMHCGADLNRFPQVIKDKLQRNLLHSLDRPRRVILLKSNSPLFFAKQ